MSPILFAGVVGGLALVLTAVFTPAVRAAAINNGLVRKVQADRWHKRPTPAIGGIAIFAGFGVAISVGYWLDPNTTRQFGIHALPTAVVPVAPWIGLLVAATVAFILGLVDDFLAVPPSTKLVWQLVAASILLMSGIGLWITGIYAVDAVISMFWFIGITNAVNLLDNMDGVASGVAGIAAGYLAIIFALEGQFPLAMFAFALAMSLAGFLAHNYPPARIFMGDSGSLFVGLSLAGLALAPAPGGTRSLAAVMAAPVLILGVPILDTTLVTIGRLLEGRPVSLGGKDHTSHRFVAMGLPEKQTAWLLWALAALGGAVGILLRQAERGTALVLGGILIMMLALTGAYLMAIRLQSLEGEDAEGQSAYRWLIDSQTRYPVLALALDGVWISLAYYSAYLLRWTPAELGAEMPYFQRTILIFVGIKLVGMVLAGIYDMRWTSMGLYDGLRMVRANVFATLLAAGFLFLLDREGLSRGVIAIDLLVCMLLTAGGRLTFRMIQGTATHLSEDGLPVVILSDEKHAKSVVSQLALIKEPKLRAVAIADPSLGTARTRSGALPMFGGSAALRHALSETGSATVLLVGRSGEGHPHLTSHLEDYGAVDVYSYQVSVAPMRHGSSEA